MPYFHPKTAIGFLTIALTLAFNLASGQEVRNPRLAYEVGYNHMGEQYLKSGICDMVPPGDAASASENLTLAEEAFQKAIEANPASIEAHLNLARLYHFEQEFDKAAAEYEEAIDLAPNDINVLVDMALLQIEMDRTDEAVKYLEQAKRLTRDERTLQHLNRFIRRPGPTERSTVKHVNSHPTR